MRGPPLPTGSVTFLLTDVEGSTAAWQSGRSDLADAIQRHYDLLDHRIGEHGGARPEEQGEGDSVVAVFPDPVAAVAAAIAAQRDLLDELPDLPVRMALHTGEATLRDERNYVGLTVIRCARIRACGHGRQILVSQATADAVAGRMPPGCSVRPLGEYGLKGLAGRTRICQVLGPGLPASFPPLRAGTSAAGNLPHRIGSFVGRRAELAAVTGLLVDHRLVSVIGDAGVGKSRLALAAAGAVADGHPGGAWWVSVSGAGRGGGGGGHDPTAEDLATTVAGACSLERRGTAVDDVVGFFGSVATSLLVVDGADAAPAAVVALVEQIVATCPDTRLIVTGRDPLELGGEAVFRLGPYPPPVATDVETLSRTEAGELFLDRLRDAGGTLDDDAVPAVVEICRRWRAAADIEMAAIRAATTPPAALLAELEALGHSAASALASSARWHLRAVSDDERTVLARLAVFRGPVDPDHALAVVAGSGLDVDAAGRALDGLTERRLLRVDGERLVLDRRLREVIGTWRPDEGGRDDHLVRYVDRFVGVAEAFDAAGPTVPVSWLDDDLDDVCAALRIACDGGTPAAYRLAAALGSRWHELDRWPALSATSDWLVTRSPTDGELAWVAAVARVSFAASGIPAAAVHALRDEATAIAALDHDEVSAQFLAFAPAATALDRGVEGPARALFQRAAAAGSETVAMAIAARLLATATGPTTSEHAAYLEARDAAETVPSGPSETVRGHRFDPVWAAGARRHHPRREDGAR